MVSRPISTRSNVLFPPPLGPITTRRSSRRMSRSRPLRTWTLGPYCWDKPLMLTSGCVPACRFSRAGERLSCHPAGRARASCFTSRLTFMTCSMSLLIVWLRLWTIQLLFYRLRRLLHSSVDAGFDKAYFGLLLDELIQLVKVRARVALVHPERHVLKIEGRVRPVDLRPVGVGSLEDQIGIGLVGKKIGTMRHEGKASAVGVRQTKDLCLLRHGTDRLVVGRTLYHANNEIGLVDIGDGLDLLWHLCVRAAVHEVRIVTDYSRREVDHLLPHGCPVDCHGQVPFVGLQPGDHVVPGRIDELHLDLQYVLTEPAAQVTECTRITARLRITHDKRRRKRRSATQLARFADCLEGRGISRVSGCNQAAHACSKTDQR